MVGGILKLMLTRGVSIQRWSNFPRVEYVKHLDNIGFVLHTSLFLAHIEEKNGSIIDREFLIKRILFEGLNGLVLADINAGTKEYIQKEDPLIFKEVEKVGWSKILTAGELPYIKEDIEKTLRTKDGKEKEISIVKAARKFAGLLEVEPNKKVFDTVYDIPQRDIEIQIELLKKELPSLSILMENENYKIFLKQIRRLTHSMRWSGENKTIPISVLAHLVIVTFTCYAIAMIESKNGNTINTLEILLKGLYHDIPEAVTGDIISPTKKSVSGFNEVVEKVERSMLDDYLFSYAGNDFKEKYAAYIFSPFEGETGRLVKYADIICALLEAKVEVMFGNTREFEGIYKKLLYSLETIPLASIKYFIHDGVASFEKENFIG